MEELIVKANRYAQENLNEILKGAFAKVYADGYRDGYNDYENQIRVNTREIGTEFIDLGLPSGTLWSKDYLKDGNELVYLPYGKADQYNIPTEEQWEELYNVCKWEYITPNRLSTDVELEAAICVGPNGNILKFDLTGLYKVYDLCEHDTIYYWLKAKDNSTEKNVVKIYRTLEKINRIAGDETRYYTTNHKIIELFSGSRLPIRLVKKK